MLRAFLEDSFEIAVLSLLVVVIGIGATAFAGI
jgi:hypothetical protein